jgi:hypothetical protein
VAISHWNRAPLTRASSYHRLAYFADLEDDPEFSLEPEEIVALEQNEAESTTGGAILGLQT